MLSWFTDNSTWILISSAVGLALLLAAKRLADKYLSPKLPEKRLAILQKAGPVCFWAIGSLLLTAITLAIIALQLERRGQDDDLTTPLIQQWLLDHGIMIILVIIISFLVYNILKLLIPQMVERSIKMRGKGRIAREEMAKRSQTLSGIFISLTQITVILVAIFTVLSELGINITPLLASAGIAGIAIGFGAQSLVKDFLAGFFILLEDQYNEGDVVKIAGVSGLVESVNFRRTIIRDGDGVVHSIPNGNISITSNFTRELSRINLNIPVSFNTDIDHVMQVIDQVGEEMSRDKYFSKLIRSAPKALRLENFGDSSMDIKVVGETRPSKQWEVAGELRKRVKKAFDSEGIEIPLPRIKIVTSEGSTEVISCPACRYSNSYGNFYCARCGKPLDGSRKTA